MKAALADDVGKHVEEILGYIRHTIKVDPSGGLLCVQQVVRHYNTSDSLNAHCYYVYMQLLNALFGLNAASQHTYIYSPYISSLPYDIRSSHQ